MRYASDEALPASIGVGSIIARYLLIAFLLIPLAKIRGQTSEFAPADFAFVNRLGELRLAADDIPEDTDAVIVRCQGFVEIDGSLTHYYCLPNQSNRAVLDVVTAALGEQLFLPAIMNDEPVRVLMNFGVFFACSEAPCLAIPIRHHGNHLEQYGLSYVAPQPILPDDDWYEGFETKLYWALRPNLFRRVRWQPGYIVSVVVNPDGTADEGTVDSVAASGNVQLVLGQNVRTSRRAPERAAESIGNVGYIPGFYGNEPVAMRLIEIGIVKVNP